MLIKFLMEILKTFNRMGVGNYFYLNSNWERKKEFCDLYFSDKGNDGTKSYAAVNEE